MRQRFFSEQMHIPTHPSTCATLKQLRHSHGNYDKWYLDRSCCWASDTRCQIQATWQFKAWWRTRQDDTTMNRERLCCVAMEASQMTEFLPNDHVYIFVFICCICFSAWQDIFLAIQAVRLLRTLRINRTRVNLVRLSRETCGNSCQVVRTVVDSGPFCQHSASILPAFCQHSASILPAFCQHSASILPAFCQHSASILPAFCQHSASILPAFCQHSASMELLTFWTCCYLVLRRDSKVTMPDRSW